LNLFLWVLSCKLMNITDVTSSVSVSASVCQGFGVRLGKFFSCFQTDVILQRYTVPFIFVSPSISVSVWKVYRSCNFWAKFPEQKPRRVGV
jgi:hypothetical protein